MKKLLLVLLLPLGASSIAQPVISALSPSIGFSGSSVAITGSGFNNTASNNIVYFGATRATVTSASSTLLTASVPAGATFMPVSVINTATNLTGYSQYPFLPTFNNSGFIAGSVNFDNKSDIAGSSVQPFGIAVGDVDGDGKPDLVTVNWSGGSVSVYRNISSTGTLTSGSFSSHVDFTTGGNPNSLKIVDMDGDGKPDIVVTNYNDNTVSVLRNTSTAGSITSGSFASKVDFATGAAPLCVTVADIDGDGKPEIIVSNNGASSISVLKNTGTVGSISGSSFAAKVDFTTGANPIGVTTADIDGDGLQDIVVANSGSNTISILRNTATAGTISSGSLAAKVDFTAGSSPRSIATGDIDGDGKIDVVVTNQSGSNISVFRNSATSGTISSGSLAAKVDFTTGDTPISIGFGDFDGDGKPDIVTANLNSNTISVLRNTATSGAISSGSLAAKIDFATASGPRFIAVGDMDGDGKADIATCNGGVSPYSVSLLKNNPLALITGAGTICAGSTASLSDATTGGTWSSSNTGVAIVGSSTGVVTAMMPGVATISYTVAGGSATTIVTVNGAPTITSLSPASGIPGAITVIVSGTNINPTPANNIVYFGATKGWVSGASPTGLTVNLPIGATYAPVSLNNTACALTGYSQYSFLPRFDNSAYVAGTVNFDAKVNFTAGDWAYEAAIGDIDGDGKSDLVVINQNAGTISVYRNTSSSGVIAGSSFASKVDFTTGDLPGGVALMDMDGDGKLDIAVANASSNTVSVFRNISTSGSVTSGSFAAKVDFATGLAPNSVAVTDIDGDGKPDMVVANGSSNTISVFRNTGTSGSITTGSFAATVDFVTGTAPYNVVAGDLDGDGKPDLAVVNFWDNTVSVFRNVSVSGTIATGSFTSKIDFTTGTQPDGVAIADLDMDGKPDMVVANQNDHTISVLRNVSTTGSITSGSFASKVDFACANSSYKIAIGDLDGDGRPDIAVANVNNLVSVFRNTSSAGSFTSGSLATRIDFAAGASPRGMAIGDLDGDNKPDLVVTEASLGVVAVLRNAPLSAISGAAIVCAGSTTTLSDATSGGIWSSSNTGVATVGSSTGVVTAMLPGVATISYTVAGGNATTIVTVSPLPNAGIISGATSVCPGFAETLSDAVSGGTWSSSNTSVATVSALGVVTAISVGSTLISYSVSNACGSASATHAIAVLISPIVISPSATPSICFGNSVVLTASAGPAPTTLLNQNFNSGLTGASGGTWTVANTGAASIYNWGITSSGGLSDIPTLTGDATSFMSADPDLAGSGVNLVTSLISPAFSTVGYTSASLSFNYYCYSDGLYDANAEIDFSIDGGVTWSVLYDYLNTTTGAQTWSPAVPNQTISLPSTIMGQPNLKLRWYYNTTWGYFWAVDNILLTASNGPSYSWTGIAGATDLSCSSCATTAITPTTSGANVYSVTATLGSCSVTSAVTVNANPAVAMITGPGTVCGGSTITLSDTTFGGFWSSGDNSIATVDSISGIVTGIATGYIPMTYTLPGSCSGPAIYYLSVMGAPTLYGDTLLCAGNYGIIHSSTYTGATPAQLLQVTYPAAISGAKSISSAYFSGGWGGYPYPFTNLSVAMAPAPDTEGCTGAFPAGYFSGKVALIWRGSCEFGYKAWQAQNAGAAVCIIVNNAPGDLATMAAGSWGSLVTIPVYMISLSDGTDIANTLHSGDSVILNKISLWSSSNSAVATIDMSGYVTGVAPGSTTISYQSLNSCGLTTATINITVADVGGPITGPDIVCVGSTITLSDGYSGGIWSGSWGASVDTIGVVTGLSSGYQAIYHAITLACGTVTKNKVVNVSGGSGSISGTPVVCVGSQTHYFKDVIGTWYSSNSSVAVVDSAGFVSGVSAGTATISFIAAGGCGLYTKIVTVNSMPVAAIDGPSTVCLYSTAALSDSVTGGIWSSDNSAIVSVDASGVITGNSTGYWSGQYPYWTWIPGWTNINYYNGCSTASITISVLNNVFAEISGPSFTCHDSSIALTSNVSGGFWTSGNTSTAIVGSSSGIVTGVSGGTVAITYTYTNACGATQFVSKLVSVNTTPVDPVISGSLAICGSDITTLSNTDSSGEWSTSNAYVALLYGPGIVYGASVGYATISYFNGCGSPATAVVTVMPTPWDYDYVAGVDVVCLGSHDTASIAPAIGDIWSGGSWSSDNSSVVSIDAGGVITGVSNGTATIAYTLTNICGTNVAIPKVVTVNSVPADMALSGSNLICAYYGSGMTTLSNSVPGGVWTSGNTDVLSVYSIDDYSAAVSGVYPGAATISYTTGCGMPASVNVNFENNVDYGYITGAGSTCIGSTLPLSTYLYSTYSWPISGTHLWTTSDPTVALVDSSTGVVTGVSAGMATITYQIFNDCGGFTTTADVAVDSTTDSGVISGPSVIAVGEVGDFSETLYGGYWSSSNDSVITVDWYFAWYNGVAPGSATISYTYSNGCGSATSTWAVTVGVPTPEIAGLRSVCAGATTNLYFFSVSGGSWSSSDTSVALIDGSSGVVTGLSPGTTTISYSYSGSIATAVVTVYAMPSAITGPSNVCEGGSITLSSSPSGGVWSSDNDMIAGVDAAGIVTSNVAGSVTITYTDALTGCFATKALTVNPVIIAGFISIVPGIDSICLGTTVTVAIYTDPADVSITWSGPGSIVCSTCKTVEITPAVAGINVYTIDLTNGYCPVTLSMSLDVIAVPSPITGMAAVCQGATTTLSVSGAVGGIWSTGMPSVASVGSTTGVVSGGIAGTVLITYTAPTGCSQTIVVTVNPTPAAIDGTSVVCVGQVITLSDSSPGGTWSGSNASVATVGSTTGQVHGVAAGSLTVTYKLSTGCMATTMVFVNPLPNAGSISGASGVSVGSSISLSDGIAGGSWTASNGNATVSPAGLVTGIAPGTVTISYTVSNSCGSATATKAITVVYVLGTGITGSLVTCVGSKTTLSNATDGGNWTTGNAGVASVGSTGVVTGIAAGTATISYTLMGSSVTAVVTVYATPAAITGTASACMGSSLTLSDATAGGSWFSGNPSIASVASGGIVTGLISGTAAISYMLPTGCAAVKIVTINPVPAAISGTPSSCIGTTSTLANSVAGGVWSSSFTSIVSVGSATAVVTGLAAGTAVVTYTLPAGCKTTAGFTVNASPANITGTTKACPGTVTTLADATAGGSWSTTGTSVAIVDASTGIVTGVAAGTAIIIYSSGAGCSKTIVVTINPLPAPIGGTAVICAGATSALTDATGGGLSWTSSTTSVATVNSSSGLVTGVAAGTTTITYTVSTGCIATRIITVNPLPAAISGVLKVCKGYTTSLSNTITGGSWISNNTAIATVDAGGVVTGVAAGTTIVTYSLATGCIKTAIVTVNPVPNAITGSMAVCMGSATTLASTTTGGTWSSGAAATAAVGVSTGIVSGLATGSALISYTLSTGCFDTAIVAVNAAPSAIGGALTVCIGSVSSLTNSSSGGTWTSSNTAVATIGLSNGALSGLTAGTSNITYSLGSGCTVRSTITVNPLPAAITGITGVCVGTTTALSCTTGGGAWSSSDVLTASVGSSGIVTGVAIGSATITYTLGTGCKTTTTVTVNSLSSITGILGVCTGLTTSLTDATTGGTWSSSNTAVASVGSATGVVTGLTAGTSNITYSLPTGCRTISVATVNAMPAGITGIASACEGGATANLTNTTGGGTWSSTNTTVATVGTTGVVTALVAGTTTISYITGAGCYATVVFTANPTPSAISGTTNACTGLSTTLTNTGGGSWSSSFTSIVSVGSSSGVVTGLSAGTAIVTYTLPTGCKTTAAVTINALPATITGTMKACPGTTTTLADVTGGGSWSTTDLSIATVGAATGIVTGGIAGTATITYTTGTGCTKTTIVTINPLPTAILGTTSVCIGSATTLSDTTAGGLSWSSSNTAVATVNAASGVVTGVSTGIATITYALGTGCIVTVDVSVNGQPAAITGTLSACAGSSTTLGSATTGGSWISGNTAVATIGTDGTVTGVAAGTSLITYTVGTGCSTTAIYTVNTTPAGITGIGSLCSGSTTTLSTTTTGGAWSSNNTAVATIAASGVVTGGGAGVANISYTMSGGCYTATTVTVNPLPGSITGTAGICVGASTTLADGASGGIWTSGNTAVATINPSTGEVSAIAAGTTQITYTLTTGCTANRIVTVNALPAAITGITGVCIGTTTSLGNTTTGGTWSSNDPLTASVNTSGVVTGVALGTTTIMYTTGAGCTATVIVSVNSLSTITGTTNVCVGSTTSLANATSGGSWSSSNTGVATVGTDGTVSGLTAGMATITYTLPSGCRTTAGITVNALPSAITGTASACEGAGSSLGDVTTGGAWSSSDDLTASVSAAGFVTAVAAGNATISYTLGTGCYATRSYTVNPLPAAIAGANNVCVGLTTTLSDGGSGVWASSFTSIVSVGAASGVVTGLVSGTAIITYTLPTGCKTSMSFTVNSAPANIGGTMKACPGTATTLTDATGGGNWTTTDVAIATVGSASGIVSGASAGTATITYNTGASCYKTAVVTINPNPAAITGSTALCIGATTPFTDATGGGLSWLSSNSSIASVNVSSGIVTGMNVGVATITYTISTGCYITKDVTVSTVPSSISGTLKVCAGLTTSLSGGSGTGTWSSNNTTVANVGSATGVVSGIAPGTSAITYSEGVGCSRTAVVTVTLTSAAITGVLSACVATVTSLTDANTGGSWASSDGSIATVGSLNGVVTGAGLGTAIITYTLNTGCSVQAVVSINSVPSSSTGTATVCVGGTTTLSNSMSGGTWASSNAGVATVGSLDGVVTTLTSSGTVNITYAFGSGGCRTVKAITINPVPVAITGTTGICMGSVTTLSDASGSGTWSSANMSVGTIGSISAASGRFVSLSAGTATVSYTFATGCARTTVVTVNVLPNAGTITSSGGFTINTTTPPTSVMLSSTGDAGGTWTSSAPAMATITSGGVVNAVAAGSTNITYSVTLGSCSAIATHTVTVTAARPGISTDNAAVADATHINIYPNPNNGEFVIKGNLAGIGDEEVRVEISNMLGEVVYTGKMLSKEGLIQQPFKLGGNLANGMYILNIRSSQEQQVLHFALRQ